MGGGDFQVKSTANAVQLSSSAKANGTSTLSQADREQIIINAEGNGGGGVGAPICCNGFGSARVGSASTP